MTSRAVRLTLARSTSTRRASPSRFTYPLYCDTHHEHIDRNPLQLASTQRSFVLASSTSLRVRPKANPFPLRVSSTEAARPGTMTLSPYDDSSPLTLCLPLCCLALQTVPVESEREERRPDLEASSIVSSSLAHSLLIVLSHANTQIGNQTVLRPFLLKPQRTPLSLFPLPPPPPLLAPLHSLSLPPLMDQHYCRHDLLLGRESARLGRCLTIWRRKKSLPSSARARAGRARKMGWMGAEEMSLEAKERVSA
jgi:hypothetical protein